MARQKQNQETESLKEGSLSPINEEYTAIFHFDPNAMAESLEDFMKKHNVISPHTDVLGLSFPVQVDEDGTVPVHARLKDHVVN